MSLKLLSPNQRVYDRTYNQNGMWCWPNVNYTPGTQLAPASAYRLARFVPSRNMTIIKIGFVVTNAATANDNVDVGLYSSSLVRLVSSGATAGKVNGSTGVQTISITSTPLTAGQVYYAGLAYGAVGGTAATLGSLTPNFAGPPQMFGSTAGTQEISASVAGATLPDPATLALTSSVTWALAVLES